jgi:hypothetical protein
MSAPFTTQTKCNGSTVGIRAVRTQCRSYDDKNHTYATTEPCSEWEVHGQRSLHLHLSVCSAYSPRFSAFLSPPSAPRSAECTATLPSSRSRQPALSGSRVTDRVRKNCKEVLLRFKSIVIFVLTVSLETEPVASASAFVPARPSEGEAC